MERGTKADIPFSNHWVYRDGELTCDGVRLTELAERFGSALAEALSVFGGIAPAQCLAHHRHTAVAHGIELADAAGFKTARHQEGIAACVDQTREGIVVGEEDGHTPCLVLALGRELVPAVDQPIGYRSALRFVLDGLGRCDFERRMGLVRERLGS